MDITEDTEIRQLCLRTGDEKWGDIQVSIKTLLDADVLQYSGVYIFFLPPVNILNKNVDLCKKLSQKLYIDQFFWTDTAYESNGFFMNEENPMNAQHFDGASHCSMSRFLIKELEKKGQKDSYNWQYLSFYSLWFDGTAPTATQVLLCFDLTDIMTARISRGFLDLDSHGESLVDGPWEVFNVLAKAITMHYDEALWGFRVPIRSIEKTRVNLNRFVPALPSKRFGEMVHKYEDMYELSRHIIHAREVLKVAADTFEIIGRFSEDRPSIKRYKSRQPVKIFQFYSSFLTNLERRAESFDRRLQNEIQLVYHLISAEEASTSRNILSESSGDISETRKLIDDIKKEASTSRRILDNMKEETSTTRRILDEMKGEISASTPILQESQKNWKDFIIRILSLFLVFLLGLFISELFWTTSSGLVPGDGNIRTHNTTPLISRISSWIESLLQLLQ